LHSLALSAVDEGMMTAESFFVTHDSALLTTADPGGLVHPGPNPNLGFWFVMLTMSRQAVAF
jgi:hypothetical protein